MTETNDTGLYPAWQPPVDPRALGRPKGLEEPERAERVEVMTLASNPSPKTYEPIYEALWAEFKSIGVTI